MAWPGRLAAALAHPRLPWIAALLSVVLASPAIGQGLQLDDHLHRAWVELLGAGEASGPWWDSYAVARDPETNRTAMDLGASPWWALPELRIRFWRPVSAATHVLDYSLWPDAAWVMHAWSLAWLGALVVGTGALLRRLLGPSWIAGLATLLFALDEAHAIPASWIAQRNALVAAVLTVAMLWAHDRARRDGWNAGRWLAPLSWAMALLAGESAVAGLGYLVAHALLLEPERGCSSGLGPRAWDGIRSLWPYVLIFVAWRLLYVGLGYGAYGSGVYVDPASEPAVFGALWPERAAACVLGALSWIDAEVWAAGPRSWTMGLAGAAVVVLLMAVSPRLRRDRGLGVLALGGALALVPVATAPPSDRLLLLTTVGSSAMLASVVAVALDRGATAARSWSRALAIALAGPVVVAHGLWAPVALTTRIVDRGLALEGAGRLTTEGIPAEPELAEQILVIVNAPPTFIPATLWLDPAREDRALPRRLRLLGSTFGPVIVQRTDERSLVLQPVGGYLGDPFTSLLRGSAHPLEVGERVELEGWSVEILAVTRGLPTAVRVVFDEPLEHHELRWITWRGGRFESFSPPPLGRSAALPAVAGPTK